MAQSVDLLKLKVLWFLRSWSFAMSVLILEMNII